MYKCIKEFSIEKCDDDGFMLENEYEIIEEGSIWFIPEDKDYRFLGGEIRLENDDMSWIEIAKESLKEYFVAIN